MEQYNHFIEHFMWSYVRGMTVTRTGAYSGGLSMTFDGQDCLVMYPKVPCRIMMPGHWKEPWLKAGRGAAVPTPNGFGGVLLQGWMNSGPCWGAMKVPVGLRPNCALAYDWARQGMGKPEGWGADSGSCIVMRGPALDALESQLKWLAEQEMAVESAPHLPLVEPDGRCVHITSSGLIEAEPCSCMAPGARWPGVNKYGAISLRPIVHAHDNYMQKTPAWLYWWLPDEYFDKIAGTGELELCVPFLEAMDAAVSMIEPKEGEVASDFYNIKKDGSLRAGGPVGRVEAECTETSATLLRVISTPYNVIRVFLYLMSGQGTTWHLEEV